MASTNPHAEILTDTATTEPNDLNIISPFEGPEKLLEIWFAPSAHDVQRDDDLMDDKGFRRGGLRRVKREEWEEMLAIVKCQVLSVVEGREMDAYLLSESSLFVSPHRLILKTCGTTLNLLGLPRILEIAASAVCNLPDVYRLFYSRKSFMFPERQQGPHKEWKDEVAFLDVLFGKTGRQQEGWKNAPGSAYTVGSVNRDHWLLYMTGPEDEGDDDDTGLLGGSYEDLVHHEEGGEKKLVTCTAPPPPPDFTIEILMSKLAAPARRPFLFTDALSSDSACDITDSLTGKEKNAYLGFEGATPHHTRGLALSHELGISDLFPAAQTTLDAFAFEPCGYSANALIHHEGGAAGEGSEGYYTIHVTPEEGWSYASFECNISLPPSAPESTKTGADGGEADKKDKMPDLHTLIQRVVKIFQPGHITLTLFVSTAPSMATCPIDAAQATFNRALTGADASAALGLGFEYRRTDKINYEFGGYDLAFASFERKGRVR
ncbi:spermidine resistance protein [Tulasnella sp. JGI-2019a]|nr:spermidine resistance protein [Tulasnella sp. JGI-2019a]KAG9011239.1 spermidine resistance protein [Tulasnella sp. JGI-2019a]KAG9022580.1 spermidine resistance protein [Tulasnella sp. JGI-2019a]